MVDSALNMWAFSIDHSQTSYERDYAGIQLGYDFGSLDSHSESIYTLTALGGLTPKILFAYNIPTYLYSSSSKTFMSFSCLLLKL